MSENISNSIASTRTAAISDLCEKAAKELKQLDTKKVEIIKNLAKEIEVRGVPKDKVARIVVRELVSRDAASPGYIYECLGIEQKEKEKSHIRKDIEQSAKVAEPIVNEQSIYQKPISKNEILVSADSSHIHEHQSGSEPEMSRWINPDEAGRLEQLESQGKQQYQDQETREQRIDRYKKIVQNFIESKFIEGFERRNIPHGKGELILLYCKEDKEYIPLSILLNHMNKIVRIKLDEGAIN